MILGRFSRTQFRILITFVLIVIILLMIRQHRTIIEVVDSPLSDNLEIINQNDVKNNHDRIVEKYLDSRKVLRLSNLGEVLYLNKNTPPLKDKNFKILVWKIGIFMEERHLNFFQDKRHDPFEECSAKNCHLAYEDSALQDADAVVFLLHRLKENDYDIPNPNATRPPGQRWVFISDESPHHTFLFQDENVWPSYTGIFNWSMMYRSESDVPVPYGRTVPLKDEFKILDEKNFNAKFHALVPNAKIKQRDVLVSIMVSNCGTPNRRFEYVKDLQKHINIDIYGACGDKLKDACPWSGYGGDCNKLKKYLFYLSFPNSNCKEYLEEKTFSHAYKKGSIPIIIGSKKEITNMILPPDSYIHVTDFNSPKELAQEILRINATFEQTYLKYHEWRRHFQVLNEHGYMGERSFHYCRLCEALNYNDVKPKVYDKESLAHFLEIERNCYEYKWNN